MHAMCHFESGLALKRSIVHGNSSIISKKIDFNKQCSRKHWDSQSSYARLVDSVRLISLEVCCKLI